MKPIKLKSHKYADGCIGTVRLTKEAESVIRRLYVATGIPIRQIASEIIVQAESLVEIVGPDDDED